MATSNKVLRQLEEQRQQDLASLELLSRDLEAYLKGPKEVKVKAAPKYVTGVTKSQGDEEYTSNIKAFGSKQVARAFGMNMGMSAVQQDILNDLEAKYGSGDGVREFVDLGTQVICHLIMQAAIHAQNGAEAKSGLPYIKDKALNSLIARPSISGMVDAVDKIVSGGSTAENNAARLIGGKAFRYLRPLNLTHIERVDARYSPRIRSRDTMLDYIANSQSQNAVIRYMVKHGLPDNVLAPSAAGDARAAGGATFNGMSAADQAKTSEIAEIRKALVNTFAKYPAKDVAATYAYYNKAVTENLDMALGLQVGDVKASLEGAAASLRDASSAMRLTGLDSKTSAIFKRGFEEAASKFSRIDATSSEADEDIVFIVADLIDLLGGYDDIGTSSAAPINDGKGNITVLANAGLETSATYGERIQKILSSAPSRYTAGSSSAFAESDIAYLDARDEICPKDVDDYIQGNPRFRDVINHLSVAFINMKEAHAALVPVGRVRTRPAGMTRGTLKPTKAFADLVGTQVTSFQKSIVGNKPSDVNTNIFKKAMFEIYEQLLGATQFGKGAGKIDNLTTSLDFTESGGNITSNWGIPESRLNQIASGTAPTFRSSGIESIIIDLVNRESIAANKRGKERRVTRDYAVAAAKMLSDVIESLRAQAENTSIALQTRSNPAMSKMQMAGYGAGSLVGAHGVSAVLNRLVQPASGSMTAHAVDYLPSLGAVGYGVYKAQQGEKDLGYSLAGGAAAHILLRCLFTKYPTLRFSENPVLKALQAPTNGLAHLIGDQSMAASALTPASVQGVEADDLGKYILRLVNANDDEILGHIACQLYKSGLEATGEIYGDPRGNLALDVGDPVADLDIKGCCALACSLIRIKCVLDAYGLGVAEQGVSYNANKFQLTFDGEIVVDGKGVDVKMAARGEDCAKRIEACKQNMAKILGVEVEDLSGFILEPGYNMDVYSGEDQVSYLQPAPHVTAQPGMVQLENAINRARKLGPQELLQEGIEDLQDVAIIRATPKTARMIEDSGMGTSLGRSRMNPGQELVALEVMGANGLWPVAPERQQSVPQGALNYAKIGHASDVTVSSEGLFNRGVFTPRYGR